MTHYIKASSEQHMYDCLEQAGIITRVYDPQDPANQPPVDAEHSAIWSPSGAFEHMMQPGVELDIVGTIHVQKHDLDLDSDGNPQFEVTTHTGLSGETIETTTNKLKIKMFTVEDPETKQQTPEMVPVRMIMPGDVDQPHVEATYEQRIDQPAQPATYYTEQDETDLTIPVDKTVGDVKTPAIEATYKSVEVSPAITQTYHDLAASLESPVAFHANIRGITGAQAACMPTINTPSKPARVWWS